MQEPSTSHLLTDTIQPGGWVEPAQRALETLARCATTSEVADHFGSARKLAEQILGFPTAGGLATSPVIRGLGRLLTGPAGPGVAVGPLALCAAVFDLLDTRAVLEVFDTAAKAHLHFRAPDLVDLREQLVVDLADCPLCDRAAHLVGWMPAPRTSVPRQSQWSLAPYQQRTICRLRRGRVRNTFHPDDLYTGSWLGCSWEVSHEWLDWTAGWAAGDPSATVTSGVAAARGLEDRVVWGIFQGLEDGGPEITEPGAWGESPHVRASVHELDLDSLPPEVLGILIRRDVSSALRCKRLPAGLAEHVEFPYDLGTIELALRAHRAFVDAPTLRWRLAHLGDQELVDLAGQAPNALGEGLAGFGLTEQLRMLMRNLPTDAARVMAEWMPADALRAEDLPWLERLAPCRVVECPGCWFDLVRPKQTATSDACRPFMRETYPHHPLVERVVSQLDVAGWHPVVPRDRDDLEDNARLMHNCSHGYGTRMRMPSYSIIRVVDTAGRLFNVELIIGPRGKTQVGQVAGRWNDIDGVDAVREAVEAVIVAVEAAPETARRVPLSRSVIEGRPRKLRRRPGGGVRTPRAVLRAQRDTRSSPPEEPQLWTAA